MSKVKFDFTGERYVVTGASSGMGKEVALELAEAGAVVLAIGRNGNRLMELQTRFPENIFTASVDVCDSVALEKVISEFTSIHGKLNGGVHAAGISELTPVKNYDVSLAEKIMNTSFWAGMKLLSFITKNKYGEHGTSTVLFSSVSAYSHEKGMFAYAASKAALDSGIRSAAKEICVREHRVNSIVPGWVKSPMSDQLGIVANTDSFLGKHLLGVGNALDVTRMVLFLLSDDARWITGSNVVVDGGYLA